MVLVTRPDLVLLMTLGCSTMAGAEVGALVLRALPELALGLAAAFLVVVAFLAAGLVTLAAVFLGAAFLVAEALVAVAFCGFC